MRWSWDGEPLLPLVLPLLALLAEGAWLTVVYVALETSLDGSRPLLGTFELTLAAAVAAVLIRRRVLNPDDDPFTYFAVVLVAGAAGWLWSAEARDGLAGGNLVAAVAQHPAGWLTAVAFMRGTGRGLEIDDRAVTRLVIYGLPLLAVPWLLGQLASGALRGVFVEEAFVATLTFMAAGFMAAGLARLQAIGIETGIDWRANRPWLGLLVGVLLAVLAVGTPAAFLLGLPVDAVARGLLGPLVTLLGYLLLAVAVVFGVAAAGLYTLLSRLGLQLPPPPTPAEIAALDPLEEYTFQELRGGLLVVGAFWALLLLFSLILMHTWLRRRRRRPASGIEEERAIRLPRPTLDIRLPRLPMRRRSRAAPTDAVSAYLAALDELASHGALARLDAETPRAHARRVASSGPGDELRLLAADYALARYGARTLSPAEDRRGLSRWRRLRDGLRGIGNYNRTDR